MGAVVNNLLYHSAEQTILNLIWFTTAQREKMLDKQLHSLIEQLEVKQVRFYALGILQSLLFVTFACSHVTMRGNG